MSDRFTKEEAQNALDAVNEMFEAIPKSKRLNFLGHFNDICLFVEVAKTVAPSKSEAEEKKA